MARSFNGSSDYIDCGTGVSSPANLTVLCWVNTTASADSTYKGIVGRNQNAAGGYRLYAGASGNKFAFYADLVGHGTTGIDPFTMGSAISNGTWYCVGATVDSGSAGMTAYLNGSSAGTMPTSGGLASASSNFIIGQDEQVAGARFLNGLVAEVAIWSVVLSTTDIARFANGERAYTINPAHLIGYWPLDGLSSPEPDISGNGNNGTLTGTSKASSDPPVDPFFTTQYYTLPRGYEEIRYREYTWRDRRVQIRGKDTLPRNKFQYEVPKGPIPGITLSTHTDRRVQVRGLDKLPKNKYQYEVPASPVPGIKLRTWTQDTTYLIGQDTLPKNNFILGVPAGPVKGFDWIWPLAQVNRTLVQLPFNQDSWPNPNTIKFADVSWIDYIIPAGQDRLPFNPPVWVVPKGPQYQVYDWQDFVIPTGQDLLPFLNRWENPRSPSKFVDSFTDSGLSLTSIVQLPFNQYQWPNPIGPISGKDWQFYLIPVGQDKLPFRQSDWPVPKGYVPGQWFVQNNTIYIPVIAEQPSLNQFVLDVPKGSYYPLSTWLQSLALYLPTPIPPPPEQAFGGRIVTIDEWKHPTKSMIKFAATELGRKGGYYSALRRKQ